MNTYNEGFDRRSGELKVIVTNENIAELRSFIAREQTLVAALPCGHLFRSPLIDLAQAKLHHLTNPRPAIEPLVLNLN